MNTYLKNVNPANFDKMAILCKSARKDFANTGKANSDTIERIENTINTRFSTLELHIFAESVIGKRLLRTMPGSSRYYIRLDDLANMTRQDMNVWKNMAEVDSKKTNVLVYNRAGKVVRS